MSKLLDSLKWDGGMWLDAEGCAWNKRLSFVLHQFGFCGCGSPEDAATYIRDGMQAFVTLWGVIRAEPSYTERTKEAWDTFRAHWPDDGTRYFFWYWLDAQELTEHGGSVPGWLTDKGLDYLAALTEALAEPEPRP